MINLAKPPIPARPPSPPWSPTPRVYPSVKQTAHKMSIIIGFVAEDGVLLCSDSQYSGGVKFTGKKIFTYKFQCGTISFALAGHEPFAKKAITESGEAIRVNRESLTALNEIKGLVERTVKDVYEQYVDTRPPEERDAARFQLLVAIATPRDGARLFSSVGTALTEVETFECFGAGLFRWSPDNSKRLPPWNEPGASRDHCNSGLGCV